MDVERDGRGLKNRRKMNLLVFLIGILVVYNIVMGIGYFYFMGAQVAKKYSQENINIDGNVIDLSSFTLRQKLAQMIMVSGRRNREDITSMNIGGVYLYGNKEREWYADRIAMFGEASRVKLFFATDLEGYWNPFQKFYNSSVLGGIKSKSGALALGEEHGRVLSDLGFTINFAPVAERDGKVWPGRGWSGNAFEIADFVNAYIEGLERNGILSVVKHYPGGSIDTLDPHKTIVSKNISGEDVFPFLIAIKNVSGVMVGHVVASGEIDSKGKPCSVSKECIESIHKMGFNGLIISDEVNMKGLRNFYSSKTDMYLDLISSGEDVILDFSLTPRRLDTLLQELEEKVRGREIDDMRIDQAVRRILKAKGYVVR